MSSDIEKGSSVNEKDSSGAQVSKDKENDGITRRKRSLGGDTSKDFVVDAVESSNVQAGRRTRSKAKPIVSAGDGSGEAPGECSQS